MMCELKSCPVCGSSNIKIIEWIPSSYSVQCLNCEARTSREYSKTLSIERWNTRRSSEEICPQFGIPGASCSDPETLCPHYKLCMKARELNNPDKLPDWVVSKILHQRCRYSVYDRDDMLCMSVLDWVLSLRRGDE